MKATFIRWSAESAGREFGLNPRTIAARISTSGVVAGRDGKYSTAEIHKAICGDYEAERLRKTREEADKIALENEKTRGGLVEIEAVYRHFSGLFVALRAKILASSLTDDEKDQILNDLRGIKARDCSNLASSGDDSRAVTGHSNAAAET